jgi:hypothetical protein
VATPLPPEGLDAHSGHRGEYEPPRDLDLAEEPTCVKINDTVEIDVHAMMVPGPLRV